LIESDTLRIKDSEIHSTYTINLYRTTCTALINGPGYTQFRDKHLQHITQFLNTAYNQNKEKIFREGLVGVKGQMKEHQDNDSNGEQRKDLGDPEIQHDQPLEQLVKEKLIEMKHNMEQQQHSEHDTSHVKKHQESTTLDLPELTIEANDNTEIKDSTINNENDQTESKDNQITNTHKLVGHKNTDAENKDSKTTNSEYVEMDTDEDQVKPKNIELLLTTEEEPGTQHHTSNAITVVTQTTNDGNIDIGNGSENTEIDMENKDNKTENGIHDLIQDIQKEISSIFRAQSERCEGLETQTLRKDIEHLRKAAIEKDKRITELSNRNKDLENYNKDLVKKMENITTKVLLLKTTENESERPTTGTNENMTHEIKKLKTTLKEEQTRNEQLHILNMDKSDQIRQLQEKIIDTNNHIIDLQQKVSENAIKNNDKLTEINTKMQEYKDCNTSQRTEVRNKKKDRKNEKNTQTTDQKVTKPITTIAPTKQIAKQKTKEFTGNKHHIDQDICQHMKTPDVILFGDEQLKGFSPNKIRDLNIELIEAHSTGDIEHVLSNTTEVAPTIIVHTIAGNLRDKSPEQVVKDIKTLTHKIRVNDGSRVLVSLGIPIKDAALDKKIRYTNEILKADRNITTISHDSLRSGSGMYPNRALYEDWIHLNENGLRRVASNYIYSLK
jgi:hypothetical protein